ncbi:MAG: hypothetical protein GY821_03475 [Gammaproteobacteria bacterium]|nr:hypothetical protein [Gammaproteobacteria bacterium]
MLDYAHYPYGIPQLSGIIVTLLFHAWRRNIFISIVTGVVVYGLSMHFMAH